MYRKRVFDKIVDRINDHKASHRPYVVGVTGVDTAGKSQFAQDLQEHLESHRYPVTLISVEDFSNPSCIRQQGKCQVGDYYQLAYDFKHMKNKLLKPLREQQSLNVVMSHLDLSTDRYDTIKHYRVMPDSVVIIEGAFLMQEEVAPYIDFNIHLHLSLDKVIDRVEKHDVPRFGIGVLAEYERCFLPAQKAYLKRYPPEIHADMIIDNTFIETPVLLK